MRYAGRIRVGTEQHFHWLRGVVATILVLNLIDAILTLVWVLSGQAAEANPLMDVALGHGPVPFVVGKLALVSLGSWLLWRRRQQPLAVVGIFVLFLVYYFVLLYHLHAMNLRLVRRWLG